MNIPLKNIHQIFPSPLAKNCSNIVTVLTDIDEEFKTQLRELTPSVLSAENLVVKSINGGEVTCRGLLEYFKVSMELLCLHVIYFCSKCYSSKILTRLSGAHS